MPEVRYHVRGGNPLHGTAVVQGAKNAALPMIGAAILASHGRTVLRTYRPSLTCSAPSSWPATLAPLSSTSPATT